MNVNIIYEESTFIEENKDTIFVLLDKKKRFYFTYNAKTFYKILKKLIDNEIPIWVDTIQGYTEVWQALCSERKLGRLLHNENWTRSIKRF